MGGKGQDWPLVSRPIFLVGAERSGTTLLRLMLNHHPQIAFCHEFEYAVEQLPESGWPELEPYHQWLEENRIFRSAKVEIDPTLSYPELVNSFLTQRRDRDGKSEIGATLHYGFEKTLRLWPEARFIHIVRDGRDVALSLMGMGWAGNVWAGAQRWMATEVAWDTLRSQLKPDQFIEVTYERLIDNPTETLAQICLFLGLVYDAAMLSYPEHTTYQSPNIQLVQQWHTKLSPPQIQRVEAAIGKMLGDRDYKLSGLPLITIPLWQQSLLSLEDWWVRLQFRRRRYGEWLWLTEYLTRRLNLKIFHRSVQREMDKITETSLQ
ncbi:MAG TPA: sulfotransferase [Stenomitos sp.]